MHGRTLRALAGLFILLGALPGSGRAANDVPPWHTGSSAKIVLGPRNPSANSAARTELQGLAKLFEGSAPTTTDFLAGLPAEIPNGECVAHDPRDDRFVARQHTLYVEGDPSAPNAFFVFGRSGTQKTRPEGLSPVDRDGKFKFRNASESAAAQIRRTVDDHRSPVLITLARTPSGVVQYCKYPLPHE